MMSKRKTIRNVAIMSLAAAFLMGGGMELYAGHGSDRGWHKKSYKKMGLEKKFYKKVKFLIRNQEEIGLTDDQVNNLRDLKVRVKKSVIESKARIDTAKVDIKSELYGRNIDTEALNPLIDAKYEAKKDKAKTLLAAFAELKSMLSDTQYQNMKDLYKEKKKR